MSRKRTFPSGPLLRVIGPGDAWPIEIDQERDPRAWDLAPEAQGNPCDRDYYVKLKEVARSLEDDALERGLWWTAGLGRLFTEGQFAGITRTPWSQWRRGIQRACAGAFIGPRDATGVCLWPRPLAEAILPSVRGIAPEALEDILDAHPGWGSQVALNPNLVPSTREVLAQWALAGLGRESEVYRVAGGYMAPPYAKTLNILIRSTLGPPPCVTEASIEIVKTRTSKIAVDWAVRALAHSCSTTRETLLWLLSDYPADVQAWLGPLVAHRAWQERDAALLARTIIARIRRENVERDGRGGEPFHLLEAAISRSVLVELSCRLEEFPEKSQGLWLSALSQHRKAGRKVWLTLLDAAAGKRDLETDLFYSIYVNRAAWEEERLAQALRSFKDSAVAVFGLQWDTAEHWPEHVTLAREDPFFYMAIRHRARKCWPTEAMEQILPDLLQVRDRDLRIRLLFPRTRKTAR